MFLYFVSFLNGSLTTASRSALIISEVSTISVFLLTRSAINPFHFPPRSYPIYRLQLVLVRR
nr:unnamed protein product [Callosobruchus analis]